MKNYLHILLGLLLAATSIGCATQRSWVYHPNQNLLNTAETDKVAVCLPYQDQRKNENKNHFLLYMIPLMPFGPQNYTVPEGATMHMHSSLWVNYKPTEDYPKAMAEELRGTGLFKEAYFDFKTGDANYIIQGTILNTDYNGKIISYGLSFYGPLLWLVGFPSSTVKNCLEIELSCTDSETKQVLLKKTYTADPINQVSWIYVQKNDFNYPEMLKSVYLEFCKDLEPIIKQRLALN